MAFQLRRGTDAERLTVTPADGEPVWTTDTKKHYVGDGVTVGGIATDTGGTEVNDLTAAVTWANIPDANVPSSAVTQHQALLTLTESQISDLQAYLTAVVAGDVDSELSTNGQVLTSDGAGGATWTTPSGGGSSPLTTKGDLYVYTTTDARLPVGTNGQVLVADSAEASGVKWDTVAGAAEVNDLTAAVTWANVPDANITQTSVTQHEAALTITESQISDLSHTDASAIHDNVAGEIAVITEKVTPVSGDFLLIEDSAAANAKKRVQVGNLPGGGGGISNVVEDTTPQLGGDLDVQTNAIVSTGTNDITFQPGGTTAMTLAGTDQRITMQSDSFPPAKVSRTNTAFDGEWATFVVNAEKATNMADGFGSSILFSIGDDTVSDSIIGSVSAVRSGADNTGNILLSSYSAGTVVPVLEVESNGTLNVANVTNYETLVTADDDLPNKKYVDDAVAGTNDLIADLTPQLGGDLDVNNQTITSTSGNDIVFSPGGTTALTLEGTGQTATVSSSTFPPLTVERTTTFTTGILSTKLLKLTTTANMADDFGPEFLFGIEDNTSGEQYIGSFAGVRDGADNSGALVFRTYTSGTNTEAMRIKSDQSTEFQAPVVFPSYTVAGVPTASSYTGGMIYVSDETGGAVMAFSDGTNWRRVTDRAIIA